MKRRKNDAAKNIRELYQGNGGLYLLCICVGLLSGVAASMYRYALEKLGEVRHMIFDEGALENPKMLVAIWVIFLATGFIVDYIFKKFPRTSGSGIPQVKGILLGTVKYKHWLKELAAKFVSGLMAIGAGLSLGREGPSVQMGSYIAKGVSKYFHCDHVKENYLITSGASAGLAGAFGAPLAGVMFSLEELHRFITGKLIICIFVSSIASDFISRRFFGIHTSFDILVSYPTLGNPYFQFMIYIIFGIVVAFFGKLFTELLLKSQQIFKNPKFGTRWIKVSFVMTLSFLLCLVLPEVTGGGHGLVEHLPRLRYGIAFLALIFVVKLLFTTMSYATGFAGGIFLPMLVLGALLGKIFALVLANFLPITGNMMIHFMLLGMVAYFVAVVKAPITGVVLILEMTGNFTHLLAFVTVAAVTYYVTNLLHLEPVYELLYDCMEKDGMEEGYEVESMGKTMISLIIASESYLDGKRISEVDWGEYVLVISVQRNQKELIPKGNTKLRSGDEVTVLLPEGKIAETKKSLLDKGMVE